MLVAESLLLGSWPIAGWTLVFFLLNAIYLIRVEEPALEQRFGEDYRLYKANVPRWIPTRAETVGPSLTNQGPRTQSTSGGLTG